MFTWLPLSLQLKLKVLPMVLVDVLNALQRAYSILREITHSQTTDDSVDLACFGR